jgi:hypothetical protein
MTGFDDQDPRLSRFASWAEIQPLVTSGIAAAQRPFFVGENAHERMVKVRTAINLIRTSWDQYPAFNAELREAVASLREGFRDPAVAAQWNAVLSITRSWDEPREASPPDFSAVKMYTTEAGYVEIFGLINDAFRADGLTDDPTWLRSAVFLIELLTIELFHMRRYFPAADAFDGVVYRGMCVGADDLDFFRNLLSVPVPNRYVAIPLGMLSASRDPAVALSFANRQADASRRLFSVLLEIHVANLDARLLEVYRVRYPETVVTSICAVPIASVSKFALESEVLLRGAHFQVVDVTGNESATAGDPAVTVRAVMLNTNRDHLTAVASNSGADRVEREFFRDIVVGGRSRLCARLAEEYGRLDDAEQYDGIASRLLGGLL